MANRIIIKFRESLIEILGDQPMAIIIMPVTRSLGLRDRTKLVSYRSPAAIQSCVGGPTE